MTNADAISAVIAVPTLAAVILAYTELWQRKEYRWDRLRAYLLSPESREFVIPFAAAAWCALCGAVLAKYKINIAAATFGWLALLIVAGYHATRTFKRGIFRPQLTAKAGSLVVVLLFTAIAYYALVFKPTWPAALNWAALLTFLPILSAVSVAVVNIPFALRKRQVIAQATRRRRSLKNLTVIGITGSYGKTSTKHFLAQVIPDAVAAQEHRNAEVAVAQDMLRQLAAPTHIYIAEMGAYRIGEIAALVRLTQPHIGIITAIGTQHEALFGSRENILAAKWELIHGLPLDGIAVLNADDLLLKKQGRAHKGRILWYSISHPADIYASDIVVEPRSIKCRLHINGESRPVIIPLASEGLLNSVLAAAAGAHGAGIANGDIYKRVQQLKPFPRTMELLAGKNGATVIDDSYSANEHGVLNALGHLALFSQQDKRIVLLPLIELGSEGHKTHERLGEALAKTKAIVYISGTAFKESLLKGARRSTSAATFHFVTDPQELTRRVGENLNKDTVVLLEGRIPDIVRNMVVM